jgi:ATP-dependent 26S proteasome regulatory subunit
MEIGLPNEKGRFQILGIHTSRMKEYKKINPDVDIKVRQLICVTVLRVPHVVKYGPCRPHV